MIICLCDGGCKGNPGEGSVGVVIWKRISGHSSMRKVTPEHTISKKIGLTTNNIAEWEAIIEALRWVKKNGKVGEDVFIYSDSMLATQQATGNWKIKDTKFLAYKNELLRLSDGFKVQISWLPRQLTCLADALT